MTAPRILHYPGSKWSMADWIIEHMPPRLQKQLHEKARQIREEWDGMSMVTLEETEAEDFDKVLGR